VQQDSPASKCVRASVHARESSSERERECVSGRGRACKRQHKSARQPERVYKRLSKRLACGQAKNHTRLTPRKKTQSLASNKREEIITRSARKKRHSSASKYKETISGQPAKRDSLAQQAKGGCVTKPDLNKSLQNSRASCLITPPSLQL